MYSLVLFAALVPAGGDLPGSAAVAPPGAVGNTDLAVPAPQQKPGFFKRLFGKKDTPATPVATSVPAAAPAAPQPAPAPVAKAPASSEKHGLFYRMFKSTDYDPNFEKTKDWEKTRMGLPD